MQCQIKYKPAFATIFITLSPGDTITAEAEAMVSMDNILIMKREFSGGFFPGLLKKIFGGESLFVNHFQNKTQRPLQVVLTQSMVGDIEAIAFGG